MAQDRRISLPCIVRTWKKKVVQSKGWLSRWQMDTLPAIRTRSYVSSCLETGSKGGDNGSNIQYLGVSDFGDWLKGNVQESSSF